MRAARVLSTRLPSSPLLCTTRGVGPSWAASWLCQPGWRWHGGYPLIARTTHYDELAPLTTSLGGTGPLGAVGGRLDDASAVRYFWVCSTGTTSETVGGMELATERDIESDGRRFVACRIGAESEEAEPGLTGGMLGVVDGSWTA